MKKLFITATGPNKGKTSFCIGLMSCLKEHFNNVGYIKPIGHRYIKKNNVKIDEDIELMNSIFQFQESLKDMSPLIVHKGFTRQQIFEDDFTEINNMVMQAYDRVCQNKDMVLIEGSGKCSVGEVFKLSNIKLAEELDAPVLLIAEGGIGRTIDEVMLNYAYIQKYNVRVLGVILNKVFTSKYDEIKEVTSRGLKKLGLEVLGVIPYEPVLSYPTLRVLFNELGAEPLTCKDLNCPDSKITRLLVGAMKPHQALNYLKGGELLITGGDREDILIAVLFWSAMAIREEGTPITGIVVTGGVRPQDSIVEMAEKLHINMSLMEEDTYTVVSRIKAQTIKIRPGDQEKIKSISRLVKDNVDLDRLLGML